MTAVTPDAPAVVDGHPLPSLADYLGGTSLKTNAALETILLEDRISRNIPAEEVGDDLRNPETNGGCCRGNLKVGKDKLG